MGNLPDWYVRLVEERRELVERVEKLETTLKERPDQLGSHKELMRVQLLYMKNYLDTLGSRIIIGP